MAKRNKTTEAIDAVADLASANLKEVGNGLRFNEGKIRHELLPAWAINKLAEVFTKGGDKYGDGNWESGMSWMKKVIPSLKRHLNAIERGEDYDKEWGLLHAAHLACNAMMLLQYYHTFPQGDDRNLKSLRKIKIGLDIDGVLADFDGAFKTATGLKSETHYWQFSYSVDKNWKKIIANKKFWINMRPLMLGSTLPFEPTCYVTARHIPSEWSQEWLEKHGFPCMQVHTVGDGASKVAKLKELSIDIYVDDSYKNFVELNKAGICTFLYDRPYNQKYDVGHKRIKSLSELL